MKRKKKIIIFMPAFNAEKTLEHVFKKIPKGCYDDIILFDDASSDNTFAKAISLKIHAYRNSTNLGYGGNLKVGLKKCLDEKADIIIEMHPDNEYDPSAILPAITKVKQGADLVLGNRFFNFISPLSNGMYFWKYFPILVMAKISKYILGVNIDDLHQGFRVFTQNMLKNINYTNNSNSYLFSFEVIAQAVYKEMRIDQVPILCRYSGKKRGASLMNSFLYTLGVFKVLYLFVLAKFGIKNNLFFK